MMTAPPVTSSVGVFDSGVGGLTVLQALRRTLPSAPLHYVADTAFAPYGERSSEFIQDRSLAIAEYLWSSGAAIIVVACNTATAHAVTAIRQRWPGRAVVGIEPGIKPAVAASRCGRIGVLATPATLASQRYQALLREHAGGVEVISQPCAGLADLIETGCLDSPELRALVERCCAPLRDAGVDTVLMGCTHYPLVQTLIQASLGPKVLLLNVEDAVARQTQRFWREADNRSPATVRLEASGSTSGLERLARAALPDCSVSIGQSKC